MKSTVIVDEYNEIDFKPSDLLKKYMQLAEKDVQTFFLSRPLENCSCPACGSEREASSFHKFGLRYVACENCQTLYVSPRPLDVDVDRYYRESAARNFWCNEFVGSTRAKRKEKIIKPRVQWITETAQEYLPGASHWVDVNTAQYGYLEEMVSSAFSQKTLLNPCLDVADVQTQKMTILNSPLEQIKLQAVDVVSLFETINRMSNIAALFNAIHAMLKPGGLCFMTTILSSGFDLQVLQDQSDNLYPPDRLNVFSVEGLRILFNRHGFECLEFSTPGMFDVELVAKALQQQPDLAMGRFEKYLLQHRDANIKLCFQRFLQASLLSSYGRIVIRKI